MDEEERVSLDKRCGEQRTSLARQLSAQRDGKCAQGARRKSARYEGRGSTARRGVKGQMVDVFGCYIKD